MPVRRVAILVAVSLAATVVARPRPRILAWPGRPVGWRVAEAR